MNHSTPPQPARVLAINEENYRTRSITLDLRLDAQPGQFVMVWLPRFDERPFSLAGADPVMLTVAAVGPFSRALHGLRPGDQLWVRGPFGRGYTPVPSTRRPLLVGGGYGVAPLAFLAERLLLSGQQPTVVIGARNTADILGVARFEALGPGAIRVITTTEDGTQGERGLATGPVERLAAAGEVDAIYACGPHGLLHALEGLARRLALPAQLSWEAAMGCAIGLCGLCEHGAGTLLCLEGPVLAIPSE
jgi:dihydroorotate dehydrogenase electron transfer subunit